MKTTRQVSELTALLSRFVHAAMPWGLCSRCGWCLVPVPCLVPVRALIVSSFNPSPASRHTQPAHGGSAVFFSDSDSDIGLLSWLALSFDDPSCHTPYPVYVSCLSALLLHLRLRCIDSWLLPLSPHHNLPLSLVQHHSIYSLPPSPSILVRVYVDCTCTYSYTSKFPSGLFSHLTNPDLAFASPHASPRFNSTHLPFDIPLSTHPPTAPRTLVRLFVW
ncbi:hypothetical protein J3E68DRAFT_162221 [Trichoderma sp. SZMC 28012]